MRKIFRDDSAQTAIEYLLILGGVILIAAVVLFITRSQIISPFQQQAASNASTLKEIIKKVA